METTPPLQPQISVSLWYNRHKNIIFQPFSALPSFYWIFRIIASSTQTTYRLTGPWGIAAPLYVMQLSPSDNTSQLPIEYKVLHTARQSLVWHAAVNLETRSVCKTRTTWNRWAFQKTYEYKIKVAAHITRCLEIWADCLQLLWFTSFGPNVKSWILSLLLHRQLEKRNRKLH